MDPNTDIGYKAEMSRLYGEMYAVHLANPGKGILNALRGNYHADDGDTHAGVEQWVQDNPPPGASVTVESVSDVTRLIAAMFGFAATLGCLVIMRNLNEPRLHVKRARLVANLALATAGMAITWGNISRLGQPITGPSLLGIVSMCLALWYVALLVNAPDDDGA